jgi:hypothetical protein
MSQYAGSYQRSDGDGGRGRERPPPRLEEPDGGQDQADSHEPGHDQGDDKDKSGRVATAGLMVTWVTALLHDETPFNGQGPRRTADRGR